MGIAREPPAAVLVCGVLAASRELLLEARVVLEEAFGPIAQASDPEPWTVSQYYAAEMGDAIQRTYLAFARPIHPGDLAAIKLRTNDLEKTWRGDRGRRVNLDPGYLDLQRLVLASTKDSAARVYIGSGVWAELTLVFRDGEFHSLPWTYPDYAQATAFFDEVRRWWKRVRPTRTGQE